MPQLTIQEPTASASSLSRTRILLSVDTIRSLKLSTGDGVLVYNDHGDTVVGTAWPSFAIDVQGIRIPPVVLSSSLFQIGQPVSAVPLSVNGKITKLLISPWIKLRLVSSTGDEKLFSPIDRQLLSIYVKETLVDLEYIQLGQTLFLSFQGRQYEIQVAEMAESISISVPTSTSTISVSQVVRSTSVILLKSCIDPNCSQQDNLAVQAERQQKTLEAYSKLGGLDQKIQEIRALVEMPLTHPEIFHQYGLQPPKGVLLYGPPGTGKTSLARAVAAATGASYLTINGPELSSAFHGETEAKLRDAFREARRKSPCIVIIDEIDALAPRREGGSGDGANVDGAGEVERRVVAQLLTLLDGMEDGSDDLDEEEEEHENKSKNEEQKPNAKPESKKTKQPPRVVVLAATNRPNALDPALRRPGRLDREIEIGIPTASARTAILHTLLRCVPHNLSDDEIENLASKTHGFVGADLSSLVREAGMKAVRRAFDLFQSTLPTDSSPSLVSDDTVLIPQLNRLSLNQNSNVRSSDSPTINPVTVSDFLTCLPLIRPSAMREVSLEPPKVRWSEIAGSPAIHAQIRELVEWPFTHSATFARLGITAPRGILLYGPPGCSKTLIARALATESGLNFLAVKGPELYSKYVGESERAVRDLFRKARAASPSIIFFDEMDALTTTRSSSSSSENGLGDRVIASLLNEIDGVESSSSSSTTRVLIIAATNRPQVIDSALLRPGRLDRLVYIGPPDLQARLQILENQTLKMAVSSDLDLNQIASMTHGCSGAEVVSICQEAGFLAIQQNPDCSFIEQHHFQQAAKSVRRRITPDLIRQYESWRDSLSI